MDNNNSSSSSNNSGSGSHGIMYHHSSSVKVGQVNRYVITYIPAEDPQFDINKEDHSLWLKIKNTEAVAMRAAYLAGPYILYVDVRPGDYDQDVPAYSTADQPVYEPNLRAGQGIYTPLYMNKLRKKYTWTVDVISQMIFSSQAKIQFEVAVGRSKAVLHNKADSEPQGAHLIVQRSDTLDLWNSPRPRHDLPVHVVVLTHGLHSNVGADMLYVKERIDQMARNTGENVIVRGYFDNVCKTEKGIKYLGRRLGDFVQNDLIPDIKKTCPDQPIKISFIAHSLGGLVQTFALAHIQRGNPEFFAKTVSPVNFICVATPFLGVSHENPAYVKFVLDIGLAGKTGRDLGMTFRPTRHSKPILQILPSGPTHEVLTKFKRLTLYANAVNDGIVPLRTGAILYLDWRAISKAGKAERRESTKGDEKQKDHERVKTQISNAQRAHGYSGAAGESSDDVDSPVADEIPDNQDIKQDNDPGSSKGSGYVWKPAADFLSSVTQPVNSLLSLVAPQSGSKKFYNSTQTSHDETEDDENDNSLEGIPKKTSMLESGVQVLSPPLPSSSFINDPKSRPDPILHDKVYRDYDLPPAKFKKRSTGFLGLKRRISTSSEHSDSPKESPTSNEQKLIDNSKVEERMARNWHRGVAWRKVLVQLEPEAHNNIVVRRRFANAYGWPVMDNLVKSHFGPSVLEADAAQGSINRFRKAQKESPMGVLYNSTGATEKKAAFNESCDVSAMMSDLDVDTSSSSSSSASENEDHVALITKSVSTNSSADAWKTHLEVGSDSDNEGFLQGVDSIIDNFRRISLGVIAPNNPSSGPSVETAVNASDDLELALEEKYIPPNSM